MNLLYPLMISDIAATLGSPGSFLRRHGLEEALQLLSLGIRQYAISKGAGGTYNETLTQFWITRLEPCHTSAPFRSRIRTVHRHLSDSTGQTASIPSLATRNAWGNHARSAWLEPDLRPLPF